jgi:hypothetical protein
VRFERDIAGNKRWKGWERETGDWELVWSLGIVLGNWRRVLEEREINNGFTGGF